MSHQNRKKRWFISWKKNPLGLCNLFFFFSSAAGCRRDKDGYYWITGRIDDMLNVSGAAAGGDNSCLLSYQTDLYTVMSLYNNNFWSIIVSAPGNSVGWFYSSPSCHFSFHIHIHIVLFLVSLRPPDEHSGGRGGSDGAPGRGRGRRSESASHGEGRVPVLLRHPQKQPGIQPRTGGGYQETRWGCDMRGINGKCGGKSNTTATWSLLQIKLLDLLGYQLCKIFSFLKIIINNKWNNVSYFFLISSVLKNATGSLLLKKKILDNDVQKKSQMDLI